MNTYPLTQENRNQELATINQILKNNGYQQLPTNFQHKSKAPRKPAQTAQNTQLQQKDKLTTFTYFGPETRIITNLFRNTNLKMAYRTANTLKHHFKSKGTPRDIARTAYTSCSAGADRTPFPSTI
jgi:hypothetical protein